MNDAAPKIMTQTEAMPTLPTGHPEDEQHLVVRHIGFRAPGQVEIFQYEEGELPRGQFRVRTLFSAFRPARS